MNRKDQYFATYQEALKNVHGHDTPDIRDEMIVALWDAMRKLQQVNANQEYKMSLMETTEANASTDDASIMLSRFKINGGMSVPSKKPAIQGENE